MLAGVTTLTKLHMGACSYTLNTIRQVAAATQLKHLTFSCPEPEDPACYLGVFPSSLEHNTLQRLTKLTHLELRMTSLSTGKIGLDIDWSHHNAVQHLSCLVKLQTLIIHHGRMSGKLAAALVGLQHLTELNRLNLSFSKVEPVKISPNYSEPWCPYDGASGRHGCDFAHRHYLMDADADAAGGNSHSHSDCDSEFGNDDEPPEDLLRDAYCPTPWLQNLTALQDLKLQHLVIQPSQLHGLTQITHLHLDDVRCDMSELKSAAGKAGWAAEAACCERFGRMRPCFGSLPELLPAAATPGGPFGQKASFHALILVLLILVFAQLGGGCCQQTAVQTAVTAARLVW
jgi:hypothetical protein